MKCWISKQDLFFELLLVCTGAKDALSRTYSGAEWNDALALAQEQSIEGVLLSAIERLPDEQRPPKLALLQWIGSVQMLEANSRKIAEASETVIKYFRENGFACNILKGSAVAKYYPQPERRQSGDVDVWVDGGREKIYDFARKFDKDGKLYGVNYHHIHFHLLDDIHIEVHIWPSYLSSPLRNWRLHKFCNLHRPTMDSDKPSLAFDRVFILLHCYRHMCGHGLGLRQIMDYFYVLRTVQDCPSGESAHARENSSILGSPLAQSQTSKFLDEPSGKVERKVQEDADTVKWIKKLGMERFARGLMWVLREYFGLEEKYLLMEPDEKEGQFIINEVLLTGNMGHSDTRDWGSMKSPLSRFFLNLRRDAYLANHYPHEAIWQPFFSIWLYFWRLSKGLLKDREE